MLVTKFVPALPAMLLLRKGFLHLINLKKRKMIC